MTALPVSGARRATLADGHHGLGFGLLSALRKSANRVNAVEAKPRESARAKAAALANPLMRDHGSTWPVSI